MKKIIFLLFLLLFIFPATYSKDINMPSLNLFEKARYISSKLNINITAVQLALVGFEKLKASGQIQNTTYITIADFSKASSEERFYVIDMNNIEIVIKSLVAHGRNSGLKFAKNFSNKNESFQSSLGFYITGDSYKGKHGLSLELNGIESGINDNAKERGIVIHGADYVSESLIKQQGYIGRSLGCPALPNNIVTNVINTIKGASCFFIYAPSEVYIIKSTFKA